MRKNLFIAFIIALFSLKLVLAETGTTENASGTTQSGTLSAMNTGSQVRKDTSSYFIVHKSYTPLAYYDDTSIYRFVSKDRPLTNKQYEPTDLISISGAHIDMSGRTGLKLRKEARDSLWDMATDFETKFGVPLTVISTYRSAAYQQRMWDLGKCTDSLCAPPGYSEHQLGLAMDIFDASTERDYYENFNYKRYIAWMKKNAHRYGWTQSYQKGEAIDNYEVEPWHWRYVGVDMATRLMNLGWTYTEYVRFQEVLAKRN